MHKIALFEIFRWGGPLGWLRIRAFGAQCQPHQPRIDGYVSDMCYVGVTEVKIEKLKKEGKIRNSILIFIYTRHLTYLHKI